MLSQLNMRDSVWGEVIINVFEVTMHALPWPEYHQATLNSIMMKLETWNFEQNLANIGVSESVSGSAQGDNSHIGIGIGIRPILWSAHP